MKKYLAKAEGCADATFHVTDDDKILLLTVGGGHMDVTDFILAGTDSVSPEEALVDLYTDNGSGESVSITEVTE